MERMNERRLLKNNIQMELEMAREKVRPKRIWTKGVKELEEVAAFRRKKSELGKSGL